MSSLLMVTELQVALASVLATAAVGVAIPFFTWLIARGNRRHERRLAHDARVYESRATLYESLLRTLNADLQKFWMQHRRVENEADADDEFESPEWLHRISVEASPAVLDEVMEYVGWVQRFHDALELHDALSGTEEEQAAARAVVAGFRPSPQELGFEEGDEAAVVRAMVRDAVEGARESLKNVEREVRAELIDLPH